MAPSGNHAAGSIFIPASICVVLPAYNEEENLGPLLDRIDGALQPLPIPYRVIVVDDGSRDRTSEIIAAHALRLPVSAVTHSVNSGLGPTIRDGLLKASEICADDSLIVTMDSDESHDPQLIHAMLQQVELGRDVVIASRYRPGAQIHGLSAFRKLLSLGASYLMRLLHPMKGVRDYTCGFRAYRKAVITSLIEVHGPNFVEAQGFHCMAEILLKINRLHVSIGEVPMILRYDLKRGESKMRTLRTIRNTLALAFRFGNTANKTNGSRSSEKRNDMQR